MADTIDSRLKPAVPDTEIKYVKTTPAFASYIDTYFLPDHEALNAQMLETVAALKGNDEGISSSNRFGWHSDRDFFKREEPAFRQLQKHVWSALTQSARRYWKEFDPERHKTVQEGWVNVNGKGAFNTPHDHALHHLSGCYYVSTPESEARSSGLIEFMNPAGALSPRHAFSELMLKRRMNAQPRAGQMIIFPAYMMHWVYPNQEEEERVTVAFNLSIIERKVP